MRGDQLVVHVARDARSCSGCARAPSISASARIRRAEAPASPVRRRAVIGVDVLAEQRDLARARARPAGAPRPATVGDRPRILGAARIGHDAEGAELVAAFLDRQERRADARAERRRAGDRTCSRPGNRCRARAPCARARARAPASRAGDDRPAARRTMSTSGARRSDLLAFGLGDAARHRDASGAALGAALAFRSRRRPSSE